MTEVSMGVKDPQLERVFSIQYSLKFKKCGTKVQALIESGNEINTMNLAYSAVLGLHVCPIDIGARKSMDLRP